MNITLNYGQSKVRCEYNGRLDNLVYLDLGRCCSNCSEQETIANALAHPIGALPLHELVKPGQRVTIITSDVTRPCPSAKLLPPVLAELNNGGIKDQDIVVVFALGSHRPQTEEERVKLVGREVYERVHCIDSDTANVEAIGTTSRGTPVELFRPVLDADVRVCLGVVEYHYFAGYSGGLKSMVPGVCGLKTIQRNHSMMTDTRAVIGNIVDNPVRHDIEEAADLLGAHFIINVILDESKHILRAVAGHPHQAHREGCAQLDSFGRAAVEQPADLVVVSAGGFPRDINLYQAQKALENARHVVKSGGIILMVAECREGIGNHVFEEWMQEPGGPDAILDRICRQFVIGGHKAAAVAMAMKQAHLYLVSELPADYVASIGFRPFSSLQEAFEAAMNQVGRPAGIVVMPYGGSVLPTVVNRSTSSVGFRRKR